MRAIGIDLGTTNSAAAVGGKEWRVLPTRSNEQLTPSVVSYYVPPRGNPEAGEIIVGRQAVNNALRDPINTIVSIKRLMGRVYGERWSVYGGQMGLEDVQQRVSYRIAPPPPAGDADQEVKVLLGGKPHSPTEVSALILKQIKEDARLALGEEVTHAVITVPAYFNERQRHATIKAGEKAGLQVLEILDEPTAAALAFGLGKEKERHRVLVYDLGGGTFDISIIQMTGGKYAQLEIQGDNWLGGDDFDQKIVQRVREALRQGYGLAPKDEAFLVQAKQKAEEAKKALSSQQSAAIDMLLKSEGGLVDVQLTVTRAQFEADVRPLVDNTMRLVRSALASKALGPKDFSAVLLVGGSTAVPLVQQAVFDLFGQDKVLRSVNPMECVALGAALCAAGHEVREGSRPGKAGPTVLPVTAMHLGIAAIRGNDSDVFVPIIRKGTPYPLAQPQARLFRPGEDNQTQIRVQVYEGTNERASLNELQGVIDFPLPPGVPASAAVEVSFDYDRNRLLKVKVRVVGTDSVVEEVLQHGRPPKNRGESRVEDWCEVLEGAVRAGKHFLATFGEFMEETDSRELDEAIQRGDRALKRDDQAEGIKATNLLTHKLLSAGVASQLFLADLTMQGAPPDLARLLIERVTRVRTAYKNRKANPGELEESSAALRLLIAQVRAQQGARRRREDKPDSETLRVD